MLRTGISLVFALLLVFPRSVRASTDCAPSVGSCDYYLCREQRGPCGERGYYLGFGYRICQASFVRLSPDLSASGRRWLERVAECLQREMENIPLDRSCGQVTREAIAGHSRCYLETGFCGLGFSDQLSILSLIGREAVHPGVLDQGLQVFAGCLQDRVQATSSPL